MAAIITKMERPKGCGGCEYLTCEVWKRRNWGYPPPDDCPIKSVDGLIEKIESKIVPNDGEGSYDTSNIGLRKAIRMIKEYCEVTE